MTPQRPVGLSLLLALAAQAGVAQEASVRLSLEDALERARTGSPRLAQLRSLHDAAEAGVRGARALRLPQLDLQASYTRHSNVPELTIEAPGAPPRTIFPNIPDNYRTRLALAVPVYTGGRIEGGVDAALGQRSAAEKDVDAAANDLSLETTAAYWTLVTARASARVLAEAVETFEAHLKDARNRQDVGMAARNEVLAVQVERDRAELVRLQAESAAEVASADLVRLTGLPAGSRIEPTEPIAAPPLPSAELESLVAAANSSRPEIAALRSRVAAADAAVAVARAAGRPQASLTAGYEYANPNTRILPPTAEWKGTWSVGVSLSITPFDGGRSSAAAAQAAAQADAVRHQGEDLARRIRLEVTSRHLELLTAHRALAVAERNVEAARESSQVVQDRHREGLVPSSERLDAELALLHAGLDRTGALAQLRVALASLDRALGTRSWP